MKKTIALFFFLIFIAAGLTADTGYKNFEWGETKSSVLNLDGKDTVEVKGWNTHLDPLCYEKIILGKKTYFFYEFNNDQLITIHYSTKPEKTQELYSKLGAANKVAVIYMDEEIGTEFLQRLEDEPEPSKQLAISQLSFAFILQVLSEGYDETETIESPAKLVIYNYNEDTRVYIFEGVFTGYTLVFYVPYSQDY